MMDLFDEPCEKTIGSIQEAMFDSSFRFGRGCFYDNSYVAGQNKYGTRIYKFWVNDNGKEKVNLKEDYCLDLDDMGKENKPERMCERLVGSLNERFEKELSCISLHYPITQKGAEFFIGKPPRSEVSLLEEPVKVMEAPYEPSGQMRLFPR